MSLRGAYDVSAADSQYNANILSTGTFPVGSASFAVNAGTMTVVKTTDSPSQNVTVGGTDIPLAKYSFTAYGEAVKVETLRVGMITTTGTVTDHQIRNVRIMVDGSQYGSITHVPAAASFAADAGTSFTTNFMVNPGTPKMVEIRGDIFDNEGDNNTTVATAFTAVQALLVGGTATSNAVPQVSLGTINVPSQTNVLGNNLTIATGSISLAQQTTYAAQTIVVPQTAYKLGAFNLVGNSTEAVNINNFEIDWAQTVGSSFDGSDDLTDLYIKYGNKQSSVKGSVTDSDNTWSISYTLAKNETLPVEVYATVGSTVTATNNIRADLTVTGVTVDSTTTVYADTTSTNSTKDAGFAGQLIAAGTGTFTVAVDATTPNAAIIDDTGLVPSAVYKFTTTNDSYTITDVVLTLPDATAVSSVNLYDGTELVAGGSKPGALTVTYAGLSVPVAANTVKVLTVRLQMNAIGVGAGSTGSNVTTTMTSATARNSQGTSAAVTESPSNPAGNVMYVYRLFQPLLMLHCLTLYLILVHK